MNLLVRIQGELLHEEVREAQVDMRALEFMNPHVENPRTSIIHAPQTALRP